MRKKNLHSENIALLERLTLIAESEQKFILALTDKLRTALGKLKFLKDTHIDYILKEVTGQILETDIDIIDKLNFTALDVMISEIVERDYNFVYIALSGPIAYCLLGLRCEFTILDNNPHLIVYQADNKVIASRMCSHKPLAFNV